jgi:hypothetical protein
MPGESPLSMMRPPIQRARKPAAGPARSQRRWPILAPIAVAVVLAGLWSCLWYYSASIAERTLAGWAEREAADGRVYSCGSQSIGGFPLSIHAHCDDATAAIKNSQPPYTVQAKSVTFAAEVYHPTRLIGDIAGPLTLTVLEGSPSLTANWTRARLAVRGVPPDPEGGSLEFEALGVDRAGGGESLFKAKSVDFHGRLIGGSPRDRPVIEVTLRFAGATATLHPLLAAPLDGEFDAIMRGLKDLSPKPWAERFREMQATGGGIEIKALRLAQAKALVVGAGALTVNAHGKLDGLVRVAIVGIEHIVPLLGVDRLIDQSLDQLSGRDGALDRLIPGLGSAIRETANASLIDSLKKMGEPSSIDKQAAIILPLRFSDGSIYVGILRVGEAPPLF